MIAIETLARPVHALVEHLVIPARSVMRPDYAAALQQKIDSAVQQSTVRGTSPLRLADGRAVALADPDTGLVVWAECSSEVTQMKVSVFFAERNRGMWRGSRETNWSHDVAHQEQTRQENEARQASAGLGCLFMTFNSLLAPKLTVDRAERAAEIKASFMGLLGAATSDWQRHPAPKPEANRAEPARPNRQGRTREE